MIPQKPGLTCWACCLGIWVSLSGVLGNSTAWARPQYFAELTRLLAQAPDEDAAKIAARLKCRTCHLTDPPKEQRNVFGQELARTLGEKRNVADQRSIRVALHRAVFLLRNRKPSGAGSVMGSSTVIRSRYVGTALKDKTELAAYEMPLSDVLSVLAANHGIEILLDHAGFQEAKLSPEVPISLVLSDVALESLLNFLLTEQGLAYHVKGNALVIAPKEPVSRAVPKRNPVKRGSAAIDPKLAETLKRYVGERIQVIEKDGEKLSELLLKLHTKDDQLDALTLYSARSSSRRRYVALSDVKEIRCRNQRLYPTSEEEPGGRTALRVESQRLEAELLKRERLERSRRLQEAYHRQRRAGEILQDETREFPLPRPYEEQLGEATQVVGAIADLAPRQAAREAPPTEPSPQEPPPQAAPTEPPQAAPTEPPPTPLARKPVLVRYVNANGQPPALRFGVRIRYDTEDPQDPKLQQGQLDSQGQCELDLPEDVRTLRVYTTPFGGFEGTRAIEASGPTTITIQTDGP